jgi:transposase-like protein
MKSKIKSRRTFSTAFKKEKVELLDHGKITVNELSTIYEVSPTAIYKWRKKFSRLPKGERVVVEKITEEEKNLELLKRISELERVIGKKQLELDFYKTAIEILNEEKGEDVLKKYKPKS